MTIVYKFTCKTSLKSYVGITTKTWQERWLEHCQGARRGTKTKLTAAIRKYGEDCWDTEILCECETSEQAAEYEKQYIKEFDTLVAGYNMTEGGDGLYGFIKTDEHKKKISQALTGKLKSPEHRAKLAAALKGKPGHPQTQKWHDTMKAYRGNRKDIPHTEETKQKISEKSKGHRGYWAGKKMPEEMVRKRSLTMTGKKRGSYSKEHCHRISEGLKGKPHKPMSEETKRKISLANKGRKRPIFQYVTVQGRFLNDHLLNV